MIHDLDYSFDKKFVENDGLQNMFVETLKLKKDKCTDYIFSCKSKRVCTSKLKPLHTVFLDTKKLSGYRMGIKGDKDPLSVEQNNFANKFVNTYIVYHLDAGAKNCS